MGFQQGLSGLSISAKSLDVISHNVANANTSGFKAGQAVFADVFASTRGANPYMQVGGGGNLPAVRQNFSQGSVTTTGNSLDMAIGGDGFFMVKRPVQGDAERFFTRAGEFQLDKAGNVMTASGYQLLGYPGTTGGGDPVPLTVPFDAGKPKATSNVELQLNLNASTATRTGTVPNVDPQDPDTFDFATPVMVYDSHGIPHALNLYYQKVPATAPAVAEWKVSYAVEGAATPTGVQVFPANVQFDATGNLIGGGSQATVATTLENNARLGTETPPGSGTFDGILTVELSATNFGLPSSTSAISQDGYPPGELASVSVSREGRLQANYTNGDVQVVGTVAIASFRNPNGLISMGDNLWSESLESGKGVPGEPGSGSRGLISSGAIESSNVDLTSELVQMIVQQRAYQANAQSIRTQDQILQTVINLR